MHMYFHVHVDGSQVHVDKDVSHVHVDVHVDKDI